MSQFVYFSLILREWEEKKQIFHTLEVDSLLGSGPVSSGGPGVNGGVTGVGDDSPDSFRNFFLGGSSKVS